MEMKKHFLKYYYLVLLKQITQQQLQKQVISKSNMLTTLLEIKILPMYMLLLKMEVGLQVKIL